MKQNKLNEIASVKKPTKKFPTERCLNITNVRNYIEQKYKIDFYNLQPGVPTRNEYHDFNLFNFIPAKCMEDLLYPLIKPEDIDKENAYRYKDHIGGQSVVLIPAFYDSKHDLADHMSKKIEGKQKLLNMMKDTFKSKKEQTDFENNMDKHIDFGPTDFSWANIALEAIHKEFSQYYIDGRLRIWYPDNKCEYEWKEDVYEYPHRFNVVGHRDSHYTDGVYYFTDIVNYIDQKYGLYNEKQWKSITSKLYEYIIRNEYIEGRYYERIWSLQCEEGSTERKFKRKGGKYGMDATKEIDQLLSIIEHDFSDDILLNASEYHGEFPIYMDTFQLVKQKY